MKSDFLRRRASLPTIRIANRSSSWTCVDQWPPKLHRQICLCGPNVKVTNQGYVAESCSDNSWTRHSGPTPPISKTKLPKLVQFLSLDRGDVPDVEETIREKNFGDGADQPDCPISL